MRKLNGQKQQMAEISERHFRIFVNRTVLISFHTHCAMFGVFIVLDDEVRISHS